MEKIVRRAMAVCDESEPDDAIPQNRSTDNAEPSYSTTTVGLSQNTGTMLVSLFNATSIFGGIALGIVRRSLSNKKGGTLSARNIQNSG
jgi:hypothetical protein